MSQAADLLRHAVDRLGAGDLDGFVGLFSEDTEFEFPFAPPGWPRLVKGRDDLRVYMAPLFGQVAFENISPLTVYETDAPGTVIAEWGVDGRVRQSGGPFAMRYIVVIRAGNGLIASYRDYWNPQDAERQLGAA
jgi:hypothetical protein